MDFTRLKNLMDQITNWRIPGADCVVYYQNEPVFRYSAGYADIEQKKPISADQLYFLYSASKVITCAAALQLFEKGAFLLTDPVSEYLPEFREMYIKESGSAENIKKTQNPILVKDLFSMTAGLSYDLHSKGIRKVKTETQGRCPTREIMKGIAAEPLLFEPGTHWNYSLCHDVLGGLIEVVSGQTFGQYLKENIFDPLEMHDTGFTVTEEIKARMASQYQFSYEDDSAQKIQLNNVYQLGGEYESGGAGLISCVDDYIKFANALCNSGVGKNNERILCGRTIDLMRTNHLNDASLADFNWSQMRGYGYGLGVRTMMDKANGGSSGAVREFGWGGAAGAYVMIDPDNGIAVFYAQHLLESQEPFVHPRIRNIVYSCLE